MRLRRNLAIQTSPIYINVITFVNLVLILLAMMLFLSSNIFESDVNVFFPKTVTSDLIKEESLIISVSNEDLIYFQNRVYTTTELGRELKRLKARQSILLKVDRRASVGRIVDVWNLCRQSGISQINIATSQ
jgi:biopolymer transport protein ExbD